MTEQDSEKKTVLSASAVERTLRRMAGEIVELNDGTENLVIVGIQRRGVQLATRLCALIEDSEKTSILQGSLDITLYRDDLQTIGPRPVVGPTNIPWEIDGKNVVIVDDVLYTGRTVRAALDEIADFGRPARIALAVLVEIIFGYPGVGNLLFTAIANNDYFVIQGISLFIILSIGIVLLALDLVYPLIDPRIRYRRG